MKFVPTIIPGAWIVTPEPIVDERGFFARVWSRQEFAAHGLSAVVDQINVGFSPRAGTLRGLHYQAAPNGESKLVSCTQGAAWDVVVDLRSNSPTLRRWYAVELNPHDGNMLYVPEGCAHGYLTLVDDTVVRYQASVPFAPGSAGGVAFDDPAFGIEWPRPIDVVSAKDRNWPAFGH